MLIGQNESRAQAVKDDGSPQVTANPSSSSLFDWRKHLAVHPAAELSPLLKDTDPAGFKELASNIWENGLGAPLVGWAAGGQSLLDGRNRLDALALLGLLYETADYHLGLKRWTGKEWSKSGDRIESIDKWENLYHGDPYEIGLSLNIHRRHLTAEQKRALIDAVLTAKAELSNRQIGKLTKADHHKVADRRRVLQTTGEISPVEKTVGADGKSRKQPKKVKPATANGAAATGNDIDTDASAQACKDAATAAETATTAPVETPPTADATKVAPTNGAARTVASEDIALFGFTTSVLDLVRRIGNHKPERFKATAVKANDLAKLRTFFTDLANLKRGQS
jgi:hypothetical protein